MKFVMVNSKKITPELLKKSIAKPAARQIFDQRLSMTTNSVVIRLYIIGDTAYSTYTQEEKEEFATRIISDMEHIVYESKDQVIDCSVREIRPGEKTGLCLEVETATKLSKFCNEIAEKESGF